MNDHYIHINTVRTTRVSTVTKVSTATSFIYLISYILLHCVLRHVKKHIYLRTMDFPTISYTKCPTLVFLCEYNHLFKFIISIKSIMLPELICSNRHLTAYFNWYCLHLKYENSTTYLLQDIALYDIHSSPCNSNSSSNWLSFNSLKVKCAFVAYRSQIIFSKINHEHPPSTL